MRLFCRKLAGDIFELVEIIEKRLPQEDEWKPIKQKKAKPYKCRFIFRNDQVTALKSSLFMSNSEIVEAMRYAQRI